MGGWFGWHSGGLFFFFLDWEGLLFMVDEYLRFYNDEMPIYHDMTLLSFLSSISSIYSFIIK